MIARVFVTSPSVRDEYQEQSQSLHNLLCDAYGPIELRHFVLNLYGKAVWILLPGESASLDQLAMDVIGIFRRRGLINTNFFLRLLHERPERAKEIVECAKIWKVDISWAVAPKVDKSEQKKEPLFSLEILFRGRRIFFGISAVVLGMILEPTRPEPARPLSIVLGDESPLFPSIIYAFGEPPHPLRAWDPMALLIPTQELMQHALEPCKDASSPFYRAGVRARFEGRWILNAWGSPSMAKQVRDLNFCVADKLYSLKPSKEVVIDTDFRNYGEVLEIVIVNLWED